MDNEQAFELFHEALKLPHAERAALLAQACGDDEALRRDVESLLAHAKTNDSFLATPALKLTATLVGEWLGHYEMKKLIGAGGMGEVYLAYDDALHRHVAVKVLPGEFTRNAEYVKRFKREAQAASKLNHQNIITIHEIGEQIIGHETQHFIVTEHIAGQTLRELLNGKPLALEPALHIAVQIADALRVAHAAGIVHRDIKPENVMVKPDGLVKVLDFGIAKLNEKEEAKHEAQTPAQLATLRQQRLLTAAGTILGTASYMAPEQAAGSTVDARADVYALGLVLREMLNGRRDDAGWHKIPKEPAAIIQRAVRQAPDERYQSIEAMLADLRDVQELRRTQSWRRRLRLSALAVLTLFAVAAAAIWFAQNEEWKERILRDGHTAGVRRAIFSPDERLLVSVGEDHLVKVWDFKRRITLKTMNDHSDAVVDAAFSPKGDFFATASWDQSVIIWDAHTFEKVKTLSNLGGRVAALAFSPDDKYLATAVMNPAERTILWRMRTWESLREIPMPTGDWSPLFFSPTHPQMLYSLVMKVNVESNVPPTTYLPENDIGVSPSFSRDGSLLLTNNYTGVKFRKVGSKTEPKAHLVHRDYGRGTAIAPDSKLAATCSEDLILWDVKTEQIITRWDYPSYFWSVAWSPVSGRYVVTTHGDGSILVWDIVARERLANFSQHSAAITAVRFTPDGNRVVSGSEDRTLTVWNLANHQKEAVWQKEAVLLDHTSRINEVAIAPNGKWMVSLDQSSELIQWDWETKTPRYRIPNMGARGLAISADGRWVGSYQGIADSDNWAMHTYDSSIIEVFGVAVQFSRDGQYMMGNNAEAISIYRAANLALVEKVKVGMIDAIGVLPDNSGFVTGEVQGQLKLWQMSPLKLRYEIGKHDARLKQLAIAPDGQTVASVGDDKKLKLWQINPPLFLRDIGEHSAPVLAVAFSPDGKQIVCGGQDRSVRVYTWRRSLWGWPLD